MSKEVIRDRSDLTDEAIAFLRGKEAHYFGKKGTPMVRVKEGSVELELSYEQVATMYGYSCPALAEMTAGDFKLLVITGIKQQADEAGDTPTAVPAPMADALRERAAYVITCRQRIAALSGEMQQFQREIAGVLDVVEGVTRLVSDEDGSQLRMYAPSKIKTTIETLEAMREHIRLLVGDIARRETMQHAERFDIARRYLDDMHDYITQLIAEKRTEIASLTAAQEARDTPRAVAFLKRIIGSAHAAKLHMQMVMENMSAQLAPAAE